MEPNIDRGDKEACYDNGHNEMLFRKGYLGIHNFPYCGILIPSKEIKFTFFCLLYLCLCFTPAAETPFRNKELKFCHLLTQCCLAPSSQMGKNKIYGKIALLTALGLNKAPPWWSRAATPGALPRLCRVTQLLYVKWA